MKVYYIIMTRMLFNNNFKSRINNKPKENLINILYSFFAMMIYFSHEKLYYLELLSVTKYALIKFFCSFGIP
jgi:hypothetical protein